MESSVWEHAFGKGDPYTLGVEEEYMLLDSTTFDLVQHIDTVLAAVEGSHLEDVIRPELMQSVLEISTPVCRNIAEVDAERVRLALAEGVIPDAAVHSRPLARDAGWGHALHGGMLRQQCLLENRAALAGSRTGPGRFRDGHSGPDLTAVSDTEFVKCPRVTRV